MSANSCLIRVRRFERSETTNTKPCRQAALLYSRTATSDTENHDRRIIASLDGATSTEPDLYNVNKGTDAPAISNIPSLANTDDGL
jgi:hypothetical protein